MQHRIIERTQDLILISDDHFTEVLFAEVYDQRLKLSREEWIQCLQIPVPLELIRLNLKQLESDVSEITLQMSQGDHVKALDKCSQIQSEIRKHLVLHQIIMADESSHENKLTILNQIIWFLREYECPAGIKQFINCRMMTILNDKYRIEAALMRRDLCQQTLMIGQLLEFTDDNLDTLIARILFDSMQADYMFMIQQKTSLNLTNLMAILNKLKVITIDNRSISVIQIDYLYLVHIENYLTRILQIVFACLQLKESSVISDTLQQLGNFFAHIENKSIQYTYHLCLSQCLQRDDALKHSILAFDVAISTGEIQDIMEIAVNTQLLYIECERFIDGAVFSQKLLNQYGEAQLQLCDNNAFNQIQENLTFMLASQIE